MVIVVVNKIYRWMPENISGQHIEDLQSLKVSPARYLLTTKGTTVTS